MYKRRKIQRNAEPKIVERKEDSDEHEMDEEDDQVMESEEVHCTFNNPGEYQIDILFESNQSNLRFSSSVFLIGILQLKLP